MKFASMMRASSWPKPTRTRAIHDSSMAANRKTVVTSSDGRGPMTRPNSPAIRQPSNGSRTIAWYMACSALHQVDVFDRDRAAVAVVSNQDRKPDRRLGCRDGENQQRVDLAHEIAEMTREGDQVDVDGKQDELDRHQDDDDVLAIEKD